MSTIEHQKFTANDLLTMREGDRYELVSGELRELHMSQESSWVAGEIYRRLANLVVEGRLGWVFPEGTSYQCFPWDAQMVRKPDTSFIARERLPEGPTGEGHTRIVPDLAVEVVSPHDKAYEVDAKVADYQEAGVPTIWVANPNQRTIKVYRLADPSSTSHLVADDELTGDGVLEAFSCRVGDLFPTPTAAE
jgi:Uma2 family endonuclease